MVTSTRETFGWYVKLALLIALGCDRKDGTDTTDTLESVPVDSGGDGFACPTWMGIPASENLYSSFPSYKIRTPEIGTGCNSRVDIHDINPDGAISVYESVTCCDIESCFAFQRHVKMFCVEAGAVETGETVSWFFDGAGYVKTSIIFDPPMLLVPAEVDVGTTWDVSTTRTATPSSGDVTVDVIEETRTVVAIEAIAGPYDDTWPAIKVESTSGQRWWYGDGLGLIKTDSMMLDGIWADECCDD